LISVESRVDWQSWATRWTLQQENYLFRRQERFDTMIRYARRLCGQGRLRFLDICCGPGAITRCLLEAFPEAEIVAADMDPWLLELGRNSMPDPSRVTWIQADLSTRDWISGLEPASFDGAFSATAIHWFRPPGLLQLYGNLATLLKPGGVLVNADHLPNGAPTIDRTSADFIKERQGVTFASPQNEDYPRFWADVEAEPAFAEILARRSEQYRNYVPGKTLPLSFHREALLISGFSEVGEVWRYENDAIVAAVR
jgi:trans-aconitate methyltransferase